MIILYSYILTANIHPEFKLHNKQETEYKSVTYLKEEIVWGDMAD